MKILFALVLLGFSTCNPKKVYREVARTEKMDTDIFLINIGNSNRAEIANLLNDINNCSPLMIAVDVIFQKDKENVEDSLLANALKTIHSDILAYRFDSTGKEERSLDKFRKFASEEGYVSLDRIGGISSHFTPIKDVNGKLYESFALKVIKKWKPNFKHDLTVDKPIPILFQRSQQQYYYFVKADLLDKNVCELLKGKIVLVGFLGPGDEDKQFTPIRDNEKNKKGEPDTYGLVIQANAIRTILEYEKKH